MNNSLTDHCVAMLLAGGRGSRLGVLTDFVAKPALVFGGCYRIIDFTLTSCAESGIRRIGILTQYGSQSLSDYIGNGSTWSPGNPGGEITLLPPQGNHYMSRRYRGTADAVYQNLAYLRCRQPSFVLILAGDHIYRMDYRLMLRWHVQHQADCTIAVVQVPLSEASRYGILSADSEGRITDFEEKPSHPRSQCASMGIYVFNRNVLEQYLALDEADPGSSADFGKNILPAMLRAGMRLYAYPHTGYWRDVGTLESLWAANMDILGNTPQLNLRENGWHLLSRGEEYPPPRMVPGGQIQDSVIGGGCMIAGCVRHSVLSDRVRIENGAVVVDSVLGRGVRIGEGAYVRHAILDDGVCIGAGEKVCGIGDNAAVVGRKCGAGDIHAIADNASSAGNDHILVPTL